MLIKPWYKMTPPRRTLLHRDLATFSADERAAVLARVRARQADPECAPAVREALRALAIQRKHP